MKSYEILEEVLKEIDDHFSEIEGGTNIRITINSDEHQRVKENGVPSNLKWVIHPNKGRQIVGE